MNAPHALSCSMAGLPRVEEALALVLRHAPGAAGVKKLATGNALGWVLADDVHALLDMPPCDRSAMDGYAFRFGGAGPLRLIGAAPAGAPFAGTVAGQSCVAIATGGAMPQGCDTVAMREHCTITPDGIAVTAKAKGAHVRRRGEDFTAGTRLAAAGTRLQARHIALLSAAGVSGVTVRPRLRTAILSVGDELLGRGADAICDANRPLLAALCTARGHAVSDLGVARDCRTELTHSLARAARAHDVILLSAGTSAGEGDHVHGALLECGGQLLVSGVAIRPGKPVSFGRIGGALVIALPGNPAAAYVTFLALGLPLLRHLEGERDMHRPWQRVAAGFSCSGKAAVREYLRARLVRDGLGRARAELCRDNGPAMLASLAQADGLVMLGEGQSVTPGDEVLFASFAALEA